VEGGTSSQNDTRHTRGVLTWPSLLMAIFPCAGDFPWWLETEDTFLICRPLFVK